MYKTREQLDPMARINWLFTSLLKSLQAPTSLRPGTFHFKRARATVSELLKIAEKLNGFGFWDYAKFPQGYPMEAMPEPSRELRQRRILKAQRTLSDSPVLKDILNAMDVVDEVFRSLHIHFTIALMPKSPISSVERYMCSALIWPVASHLRRDWRPFRHKLRSRASKAEKIAAG